MSTARQVSCAMRVAAPAVDLLVPLPLDFLGRARKPVDGQGRAVMAGAAAGRRWCHRRRRLSVLGEGAGLEIFDSLCSSGSSMELRETAQAMRPAFSVSI